MSPNKIAILVITLVAIGSYYFFTNFEYVTEIVDDGPSLQVKKFRYLGARLLLKEKGIESKNLTSLKDLDTLKENDVLVLTDETHISDTLVAEKIIQWVKSGGHLIWAAHSAAPSPLADAFQIKKQYSYYHAEYEENEDNEEYNEEANEADTTLFTENKPDTLKPSERVRVNIQEREEKLSDSIIVYVTPDTLPSPLNTRHHQYAHQEYGSQETLWNAFPAFLVLNHPLAQTKENRDHHSSNHKPPQGGQDNEKAEAPHEPLLPAEELTLHSVGKGKSGIHLLHFSLERGFITVVSTTVLWSNNYIGLLDNAHLLMLLTEKRERVMFQETVNWPSLWELLSAYALEVIVAVGLFLLAWAMKSGVRFGPLQEENTLIRRSLAEHIRAMGQFYWRHEHHNELLSALRSRITQKMMLQDTAYIQYSDHQQCELIAKHTTLPIKEVTFALLPQERYSEITLFHTVKTLRKIQEAL
ncbi:DUF4350 domain-containing protein [Marinibactrum halimedae]|uniref:DUF4350 domain-containing protein n=1 Tax=Marinibactrum halimedae TaxID=1444977 RepID=A0AA37TD47_9GAMM|nr:DUF4350 domain-containing protein [Marinibactrum halimedae]MCD9460980.1 DUF4350 domain-containing protein [Marinibactrum halimedae]GLS28076.1 hypothetical protein GCM10007877_37950 [Marinibactrum halimedae]